MAIWGIFGRQPHRRDGWKGRVSYEREEKRGGASLGDEKGLGICVAKV